MGNYSEKKKKIQRKQSKTSGNSLTYTRKNDRKEELNRKTETKQIIKDVRCRLYSKMKKLALDREK